MQAVCAARRVPSDNEWILTGLDTQTHTVCTGGADSPYCTTFKGKGNRLLRGVTRIREHSICRVLMLASACLAQSMSRQAAHTWACVLEPTMQQQPSPLSQAAGICQGWLAAADRHTNSRAHAEQAGGGGQQGSGLLSRLRTGRCASWIPVRDRAWRSCLQTASPLSAGTQWLCSIRICLYSCVISRNRQL